MMLYLKFFWIVNAPTLDQQTAIRTTVAETFGEEANIWLFGSRVDDNKRGGDIDLLILDVQVFNSWF